MKVSPRVRRVWLALLLALFPVLARAGAGTFEPLTIVTKQGRFSFQVEVMRDRNEQRLGMMYRRALAPDKGMLFQYDKEQVSTFWMKNTYVPLDMIFITAAGTVHRIAEAVQPLSTQTVSSGAPVLGVLEVVAGTAKRIGLESGDRIEHEMFPRP